MRVKRSVLRGLCALLCMLVYAASTHAQWVELYGCRIIPDPSNDGDSFRVQHDGNEYIFRLYFVDAPETDMRFPDRVRDQAAYHGITTDRTIELGKMATQFAMKELSRPFVVATRWQNARGSSNIPRYYAFVLTGDGGQGEADLAVLLVQQGLARIHGVKADAPSNGPRISAMTEILLHAESGAKRAARGGWGAGAAVAPEQRRMSPMSIPSEPLATMIDIPVENDVFADRIHEMAVELTDLRHFVRETPRPSGEARTEAKPATRETSGAAASQNSGNLRININTASPRELQTLPGIGPKLAQAIVAARPFESVDELLDVPGIGPKTVSQLVPYVTP